MLNSASNSKYLLPRSDFKVAVTPEPGQDPHSLRSRSAVTVQSLHAQSAKLSDADGQGLRKLPNELLAVVAAASSDSMDEALPLLSVLTAGWSEGQKSPTPARRATLAQIMLTSNPTLAQQFEREQLLQQFSPSESLMLEDAGEQLTRQALDKKHQPEDINAWLFTERTIGRLIAKAPRWINQLAPSERTDAVVLAYHAEGGSLAALPPAGHNQAYWQLYTSGPQSEPHHVRDVPEEYRTQELLRAAVAKHPEASQHLRDGELS